MKVLLVLVVVGTAGAARTCKARCGSQIGFLSNKGPDLMIEYDGSTLTVPQHCREETCTTLHLALAAQEAKNVVQEATNAAQAKSIASLSATVQRMQAAQAAEATAVRGLLNALEKKHDLELADAIAKQTAAEQALQLAVEKLDLQLNPPTPPPTPPTSAPTMAPTDAPTVAPTSAPTPVPYELVKGTPFEASKCMEVQVSGGGAYGGTYAMDAGYNKKYPRNPDSQSEGGQPSFGKDHGDGRVYIEGHWGWGIGYLGHHRYYHCGSGGTIESCRTIRPGLASSPIPTLTCTKYLGKAK